LVIPPGRLRALLVAEAELGERIIRALILRRVAILHPTSMLSWNWVAGRLHKRWHIITPGRGPEWGCQVLQRAVE
jgi:hypothetical protein